MRNRFGWLMPILGYLGALFWMFGFVMLAPIGVLLYYRHCGNEEVAVWCYILPAAFALLLGLFLKRRWAFASLDSRGAMMACALGWICVSALGALPFYMALDVGYLDAFFESVSGFTTTGITMLTGLDYMPRSILFWRSFIQWLGGLGILTFFLALVYTGGTAHQLFTAESHKIFSKRPVPGLFHTLRILWAIYAALTMLIIALLRLEGMGLFDAVCHSFTALSTGGYSPYDASIDYYRQVGHPHYIAIEYTLTLGMLLGGINFVVHYRVLTGHIGSLWDNLEMRLLWAILGGALVLVALNHAMAHAASRAVGDVLAYAVENIEQVFRHSLFQIVAILTTTGFATKDIGADYFPALSKQIFLVLMVIGGCVGSTGGGIKVLRIGVLIKMVTRQLKRVIYGRRTLNLVVVDGESIDTEEVRRISALFFAWIALLAIGGGITALLSDLGAIEAASGMFSALGNIGPCYISVKDMTELHPIVKITYIVGMLAGRLEIVPILLLFYRRSWR